MKYFGLLLMTLSASICAGETRAYYHNFLGITPGKSTLADVIAIHESPRHKVANSNNVKYHFDGFDVTIQDTTGRANTIIIYRSDFTDPNGLSVGHSRSSVSNTLGIETSKNYLADKEKGIFYWFKNDQISKIVLAHRTLTNN